MVSDIIVKIQGMFGFSLSGLRRALLGFFTCIFALGGAIVGIITGALKGQTTETGFVRGAGIGAVTGAVTAVQLLELVINGESLSKVSTLETSYDDVSNIYDTEDSAKGLSRDCIERLPTSFFTIRGNDGCSICLQEFEGGEYGRRLPNCGHIFHLGCLDSWLIRSGSCPMCRDSLHDDDDNHHLDSA